MRRDGRRAILSVLGIALAGVFFGGWAGSASAEGDEFETRSAAEIASRGFRMGIGWQELEFDYDLDARATPLAPGVGIEQRGRGPELSFGWGFGPKFATELDLAFAEIESTPNDAVAGLGTLRAGGIVSLLPGARARPVLLGGFGITSFFIDDKAEGSESIAYFGLTGDFGAGFRFTLARHLILRLDYLYTVHDIEREVFPDRDEFDTRHVGGTAWSRRVRAGLLWDF